MTLRNRSYEVVVDWTMVRLRDLGLGLTPPETLMPEFVAPWALLRRATLLLESVYWLLEGPSDAAVRIIARTIADLDLTVTWLRLDPDVHVKLWVAEQSRREVELGPELETTLDLSADGHRVVEWKRSIVQQARAMAREHEVAGVGRQKGPLIPNLRDRASAIGSEAARVSYELVFGPWSEWGHTGAGSLDVVSDDESVTFGDGPPREDVVFRGVLAGVYAHLLSELSTWLGLGIDAECDGLGKTLIVADAAAARRRQARTTTQQK